MDRRTRTSVGGEPGAGARGLRRLGVTISAGELLAVDALRRRRRRRAPRSPARPRRRRRSRACPSPGPSRSSGTSSMGHTCSSRCQPRAAMACNFLMVTMPSRPAGRLTAPDSPSSSRVPRGSSSSDSSIGMGPTSSASTARTQPSTSAAADGHAMSRPSSARVGTSRSRTAPGCTPWRLTAPASPESRRHRRDGRMRPAISPRTACGSRSSGSTSPTRTGMS